MLYQIYETQRSVMEPFADFALAASRLYGNPGLPFQKTKFAQGMSAGYELLYRLAKDYVKPEFNIPTVEVDGVEIAIHERVEMEKPFCELLRFKRFSDDPGTLTKLKDQPAVLIVAPLSGHYATLLRDTVRTMLQGHKVYVTDWKNARMVPMSEGEFHLDDYVNYVQEFIRHLQGRYGNCHVVSVCQPTVPVLAAVSLMASRGEPVPQSMTMMGGPIDARKSPTSVNELAVDKGYEWFENNVIYPVPDSFPGRGRRVYPGFLQHSGFLAMNPNRHAGNHFDFFKNLVKGDDASTEAHRAFYDEYNAVLDMDAAYYLETIETVFQKYKLVNGTWDVRAPDGQIERVKPQDIRSGALLTVEGELDDISGSGQTRAAHALCTGLPGKEQSHIEVKGAGHYGIFSGRRWREIVYPQVRDFIAKHDKSSSPKSLTTVKTPAASVDAVVKAGSTSNAAAKRTVAETPSATNATRASGNAPAQQGVEEKKAVAAVSKVKLEARGSTKDLPKTAVVKPAPSKSAPKAIAKPAAAGRRKPTAMPVTSSQPLTKSAQKHNGPATRWVSSEPSSSSSGEKSTATAAEPVKAVSAPATPGPSSPTATSQKA